MRFYYGWWIVITMAAVMFVTTGTFFYGFATLVDPLNEEFGWSRALIGGAFSLRSEMGGIQAPIIGYFIDRAGSRILLIVGIILVGGGFIAFSLVQELWQLYVVVAIIGLGLSSTGGPVAYTAVAHWFVKKRGRATSFVTLGGGASGVMVMVLAALIAAFGWRTALVITGVSQIVICLPLALIVKQHPEDVGLLPDGEPLPEDDVEDESLPKEESRSIHRRGLTMRQALGTRSFWMLSIAFALVSLACMGIVVHQIAYLKKSAGFSASTAAQVATAMTIISLAGRLGFGYLADFVDKKKLLAVAYLLIGLGVLSIASIQSQWQIIFYLVLFSPGWGASIALRPVLQAEYFGLRAFGGIQGLTFLVSSAGSVAGPVFVGAVYDSSGDYRPAFLITAVAALVAVPIVLALRPPKLEEEEEEEVAALAVSEAEADA